MNIQDNQIRVLFVNHLGGGFADRLLIPQGTTSGAFVSERLGGGEAPRSYTIRHNGQECASSDILSDGDRLTVTPSKVEGALSCCASCDLCHCCNAARPDSEAEVCGLDDLAIADWEAERMLMDIDLLPDDMD
jgi:hypothetical protein